jgi:hypothetical protein
MRCLKKGKATIGKCLENYYKIINSILRYIKDQNLYDAPIDRYRKSSLTKNFVSVS